ncbi:MULTISPECIES: type II toxin-antitoxin system RelE/ParE family toxin [unclassified Duganella]|uniref:type II toxin-antitoxin system RelE/ParE family toxin n=1 Tax=unclassified Duganella TaxID=2636909 RepID=UPI000B7EB6AA
MPQYSVRITFRAAAQIQQLSTWWQQNRLSAPGTVATELERAFALLEVNPNLGARTRNAKLSAVRRIHLPKIHHHVYYRIRGNVVEVVALWHTSRDGVPPV